MRLSRRGGLPLGKNDVQVIKPKTAFDRRLARLEQQRIWEYVGKTVLDDAEAIRRAEELALEAYALSTAPLPDGAAPSLTMRLRAMSVCKDFMEFAHRVRKETFQDRTIPTLQRVQVTEAIGALPMADDERETMESTDPRDLKHKQAMEAWRKAALIVAGVAVENEEKIAGGEG